MDQDYLHQSRQPTDVSTTENKGPSLGANAPGSINLVSSGWVVFGIILSLLPWFLVSYGAAKLSFNKYQSYGWAILDFFFAGFYYPYYAYFIDSPHYPTAPAAIGGRR
jgi:hypothetical protein